MYFLARPSLFVCNIVIWEWHLMHTIYRISSKSRRGEILFQGSVWCGDNSRAASTEIDTHARTHKPSCMHVKCPCAYGNCCRPLTMRRDFEGGVYWDELADRCGDISRAAGFRGVARFRGNTVTACSMETINFCSPRSLCLPCQG